MSLLQDMLNEMASGGSTGAGGIANARGSLFGGSPDDIKKSNRARMKVMRRIGYFPVKGFAESCKSDLWNEILEGEDTFDKQDVISKLDAAEKRAKADKDTAVFGLEDEDQNIVKVYVRADQGDDFEQALATMLSGADEDEDGENTSPEIAEVLYNLKDKFEIVDVEWPTIDGDEEEEQDLEGGEEGMEGEGGEGMEGDAEGMEGDMEGGMDDMGAGMDDTVDQATSALQSVIDVMKADAEAKKAEAEARKAEADAEIAKHASNASAAKVQQEEEILDMEAHEKTKSDSSKEAKTLAKLAKYKHEIQGSGNADIEAKSLSIDDEENEEEQVNNADTISKEDLADLLFKAMAYN